MNKIVPYEHGAHVVRLMDWLRKHGLRVPDKRLFSDLGLVVNDIAIGFLFEGKNSKQAYIDHVAADPAACAEDRDIALNLLFKSLEARAREDGYLIVTALAELPTMKRRFESHGYQAYGQYSLYYKVL